MSQTPTPAAPSLAAGEDTGSSDSDGITDVAMPTLVGRTLPNATVTIYDNDFVSIVGTATADALGNYDVVLSQVLNDGKNILTATAAAPGETASVHSAPLTITVDTAAPDLPTAPTLSPADDTGASALDGMTNKTVLHLTGRSEPGATVSLLVATVLAAGGAGPTLVLATATVAADGSYTLVTPSLADATYTFSVVATDVAGNTSHGTADNPIPTTTIVVDTKAPAAPPAPTLAPGSDTGALRTDGLTDDTTPVVVGTTEANATVYLFDGDGTLLGHATADANGAYAITTTALAEGSHLLGVKSVDAAGNVSAASPPLAIVVDTTAATGSSMPVPNSAIFGSEQFALDFGEPVAGLTARSLSLSLTGTAQGSIASVTGSGSRYVVTVEGLTGAGTVSVGLEPGAVTDLAGNPATLSAESAYQLSTQPVPSPLLIASLSSGAATDDEVALSAGGRLVAFDSADGLPAYDSGTGMLVNPGTAGNIYVEDVRTGALTVVSAGLAGALANGASDYPKLSDDGSTIVFVSSASNLVADAPTDGSANVYVAHLSKTGSGADEKIVVSGVTLLSVGHGHDGISGPAGTPNSEPLTALMPSISADGGHVVFVSNQPLLAGMSGGVDNVFEADLATGALSLVSGGPAGTGGLADAIEPTVSADGSVVAYDAGTPLSAIPSTTANGLFEATVYSAATGATTPYYGATQLGIDTSTPVGGVSDVIYDDRPQVSSDGNWLTYTIVQSDPTLPLYGKFVVEQSLKNPAVILALSPLVAGYEAEFSSINQGGRYVAYTQSYDSIDFPGSPQTGLVLDDTVTGTKTDLSPSVVAPSLSDDGDAIGYVTDPASGPVQVYLQPLGAVVQVDAVGDDDRFGAAAWKQVQTSGLLVSGTTNQPDGASVILTLTDAAGDVLSTLSKIPVAAGAWSVTIPAATLAPLTDGGYVLSAIVDGPAGASFPAGPAFTVDTTPPDAPDAPKLDPGSDSSLAADGSATNSDTPTLTGTAEAGATITLYDAASTTPTSVLATATADANGVYAVTPDAALIDGTAQFAVTATDAAGNVSALSAPGKVLVDTVAPDRPNAPALAGAYAGAKGPVPASDTGASASDGITDNASPTFTGLAEAKSVVTLYDTDGVSVLGTATASAAGTWLITPDNGLSDGSHVVTVTATDAAGNVSPRSAADTVTIDTLPPLMPVITDVSGDVVNGGSLAPLLTVTGTAEPGSTVALRLDGGMTDLGTASVNADGDYSIDSDALPAGAHMLAVVATDVAGNASQPSLQTAVTIAANGGVPAAGSLAGVAEDGYLSGATVFADANGNGVLDPGETSTSTDPTGRFTLDTGGTQPALVATGGIDTMTGVDLPGPLLAPPGSTVITALTTLLAHLASVSKQPVSAALLAAEAQALGLSSSLDLQTLDPIAAATAGDASGLIASAKIMDTAVAFADVLAVQTGASRAAAFAAALDALARAALAAAPTPAVRAFVHADAAAAALNFDDEPTLEAVLAAAAAQLVPGLVLPSDILDATAGVVASGNAQLDLTAASSTGAGEVATLAAVETVEQAEAAPALAAAGGDANALNQVEVEYAVDGNPGNAVTALQTQDLGAPALAPGQDTGRSNQDDVIDGTTPGVVGNALPGATVALLEEQGQSFVQDTVATIVVGIATADLLGHYTITSAPLASPSQRQGDAQALPVTLAAVDAAPGQSFSLGEQVDLPDTAPVLQVEIDPTDAAAPSITEASAVAAPGDDASHAALYVYGSIPQVYEDGATISVYADGDLTPIATSSTGLVFAEAGNATDTFFGLTTSPLSVGQHVLTVTATLPGGTVVPGSSSFTLAVAVAPITAGLASGVGALVDARVYDGTQSLPGLDLSTTVEATTTGVGAYQLAEPAADADAGDTLLLTGGYDATTGLPLGGALSQDNVDNDMDPGAGTLMAPLGSAAITPLTTIETLLEPALTPAEAAAATLAGLGLPANLDLAALDPLAEARDGDVAPLLVSAELLDTVTMLAPFTGFSFAPLAAAIAGAIASGGTLDLASAAGLGAALAAAYPYGVSSLPPATLQALAGIIAASNQSIASRAADAVSLADTLSWTLAAEQVAQEAETAALRSQLIAAEDGPSGTTVSLAAIAAAYTGAALDAAIAAARAQSGQVTGFDVAGPLSTPAASVDFTIAFGEPISGLAAADFSVIASGDLIGAHVTGLAPVAGSDGATYAVTVATGAGQGTLALAFDGSGILTAAGHPLSDPVLEPAQATIDQLGSMDFPAVGDFNGDGKPDVVVETSSDSDVGRVSILLNQGDGTFTAGAPIAAGEEGFVDVADINGDGRPDIVTAGGNGVAVLLGRGDGTFAPPIVTPVAGALDDRVTIGDFNHDGRLDLVEAGSPDDNGFGGSLALLLGNGDGTFQAPSYIDIPIPGSNPPDPEDVIDVASADLNGDGSLDLVALQNASNQPGQVSILLGDGEGAFRTGTPLQIPANLYPDALAVADLNGDGIPDVVVLDGEGAAPTDAAISVFLGNGDGTFRALPTADLPGSLAPQIAVADMNGDGIPDLVIGGSARVQILTGNGDGTFSPGWATDAYDATGFALADVNADGRPDLLLAGSNAAQDQDGREAGLSVLLNTPETVLGSTSQAVSIDRPVLADPVLTKASGPGALTQSGNAYALDLGAVAAAGTLAFALANAATGNADSVDGLFSAAGTDFAVTGDVLPSAIAAGASYTGLAVTALASTLGTHTETITFAPRDVSATPATSSAPDGPNAPGATAGDAVGLELAPITLTITDDVVAASSQPPASLAPVAASLILPNVHLGSPDSRPLTLTNSAAAGAAELDVTATASGGASVTGSVTALAPGASSTALSVGLDTGTAGAASGVVTLDPVSVPNAPLASAAITLTGAVYREASAGTPTPVSTILHVGDPGTVALTLRNADPADGFSESLVGTLAGLSPGLTATATTTADIAAAASATLTLAVSTANAGTITGAASVALSSDGGSGAAGLDGLGVTPLGTISVPVSVTVDNFADPLLEPAGVSPSASGTTLLDLGTLAAGSVLAPLSLTALNAASAPADALDGSYTLSGPTAFSSTGFGGFTDIAAGGTLSAGTLSLDTSSTGTFTETVVLHPTDVNAGGFSATLPDQTVIVTADIVDDGTASGDVHLASFDGLHYDMQSVGDFVLARSTLPADPFEIQIRTAPSLTDDLVSVTTEAAARIGADVVTFEADGSVLIDGILDTALDAAHPRQLLAGGTLSALGEDDYQLLWSSGEQLDVTNREGRLLNLTTALGPADAPGSVQGLLGPDRGAADAFTLPNGAVLPALVTDTALLDRFADAWRVAPGASLLGGEAAMPSGGASPPTFLTAAGGAEVLTGSAGLATTGGVTIGGTLQTLAGAVLADFGLHDRLDVAGATPALVGGQIMLTAGAQTAWLGIGGPPPGQTWHTAPDLHGGVLAWFS